MNEQSTTFWDWLRTRWDRLVTVDVPHKEKARKGRLFNTLLLISVGITLSLTVSFLLTWLLGMTERATALLAAAFPLVFIPLSFFCMAQAKRGRVRPMVTFYVWTNFVGIGAAALTFEGIRSPAWVLYAWTITIAGTLLAPRYSLIMTALVMGYFGVLFGLERLGLYTPFFTLGPAGREFTLIAFTLVMLVTTVGLLTYLNMRNLSEAMGRLRRTRDELEEHRRTLEQQVATRTADLEERTAQLETAAQVARDAAEIHEVNDLLDRAVRIVSERFDFYHAGLFLLDDLGEYAILRSASSEGGQRMLEHGHRLEVGREGIVGYVAQAGEPRIALDVGDDAVFFDNPDLPLTRSEMALPLEVRGEVIGVLDVQSTEAQAFDDDDVAILQTMADQVALAIDNARLLEEAQAKVREVRALLRQESMAGWERAVTERSGWRYVYEGGRVREEPERSQTDEPRLTVPLRVRDEAIGRLTLDVDDRPLTAEEQALVESVAGQASQALESARLFQETQRALQEVETLNTITRTVSGTLDLEGVLEDTLAEILSVIDFESGLITLLDPRTQRLRLAVHSNMPEDLVDTFLHEGLEGTLCHLAYQRDKVLVVKDMRIGPPLDVGLLLENGFRSYIGAPLASKGEKIGTLCALSFNPRSPRPSVLSLLEAVGQQVGVAVENARLFENARQRAERERLTTEITSQVRASADIDAILRTAVRELGQSLRASEAWIQLEAGDDGRAALDEQVVNGG